MNTTRQFSKRLGPERLAVNLARLKKNGKHFEIVVDPDKAIAFRHGKLDDYREAVHAERIFENAQKGIFSTKTDLELVFPDMTEDAIAEHILRVGELQLSSQYRKLLQEHKKNTILETIHRNAINPDTNLPHPLTRIKNAFDEANIRIDDKKSAEDQVQAVLKKLKTIIPIRFEVKRLQLHLNAQHVKKNRAVITSYGQIIKEEVLSDGCVLLVVEVPAGMYTELIDELNKRTRGGAEIHLLS